MPRAREIGVEDGRQPRHRVGGGGGGRSSGTEARSAASTISGGGAKPPVTSTQGRSWPKTRASARGAIRGAERLDVADLALAEHEHAAAVQVGVETRQREAGLLRLRDGDPALERRRRPASSSSGEDARVGEVASRVATVTPVIDAGIRTLHRGAGRPLTLLWLDQPEITVFPPVEDRDARRRPTLRKTRNSSSVGVDAHRGVFERHRLDGVAGGPMTRDGRWTAGADPRLRGDLAAAHRLRRSGACGSPTSLSASWPAVRS